VFPWMDGAEWHVDSPRVIYATSCRLQLRFVIAFHPKER
jgi:hypothetical protein